MLEAQRKEVVVDTLTWPLTTDLHLFYLLLLLLLSTGGCFGAVIVKDGKIVGEGYNNVVSRNDPTW